MASFGFGMLLFLVTLCTFPSSTLQACTQYTDMETEMAKEGYAYCPYTDDNLYMSGFTRKRGTDDLRDFKTYICCQPPPQHRKKPYTCTSADWDMSFSREGWAVCSSGHFLRELHRGGSHELKSIQWATCCKPALHPHWYKQCYEQDVGQGERMACSRNGYYVVGIHRGASEKLSSINKLRCCNMYDKPLTLKSVLEVKTRVMDITQENLALLANDLGYGWAGGCRGRVAGQDFVREGDSWRSHYQQGCSGYMSTTRLKIHYDNFSFRVKNIDYGKPEIESMKPIVQDVGEIKNLDSQSTKSTIARQIKTVRTVTHSSSTRFKSGWGASVTLSYKSPGLIGEVATGTFKASVTLSGGSESAQLNTKENGDINWDIVQVKETQTTEGNSGSSYQITTSQKKVNVPYKATIQVQFTATLDGFLIWGGGANGDNPNYHERYRGSGERPIFKYKIGTEKVPFYTFLKQASQRGDSPWLWNLMKQNKPYSKTAIDILTDESLYEFELEGKFHDVAGFDFNVQWDDVAVGGANSTIIA
ncbi:uncharacterized protein LOC111339199 [Stylophora pistillata]|uniref:Aerolysin n=1 Tax=Stylophora pistillata TaxID=50429 RepID=A0A2B4RQT2_STYPI|nr:uncharacterized protein LOC111339199 [Stylophora pistillata]PFX18678.1 Aerolysin [Stylophora pistillata]